MTNPRPDRASEVIAEPPANAEAAVPQPEASTQPATLHPPAKGGNLRKIFTLWFSRWGRLAGWLLLIGFILLALDQRCHAYFTNPDLRAEDGKSVFAFFYQHRELKRLIRVKAGYVPLLPNMLGYISVRLPPPMAPYFLTLVPVVFTVAAFSVFNASAFRRYVRSEPLRACCCLGLAMAPLGSFFLVCHTDYSIWNLFILLLWLVILPMPERKWHAASFSALLAVLIWSHPLSVAALPPTLYWLWAEKRLFNRVMHSLVLCTQALHLIYGTHPETANVMHRSESLIERGWGALVRFSNVALDALGQALFPYANDFSPRFGQACAVGLVLALVVGALLPGKRQVSRMLFLWILYCMVVPLLMVVLVRARGVGSSRYIYVLRVFALVGGCISVWEALNFLGSKLPRLPRLRAFAWLPELLLLVYCASLNRPGTNELYRQPNAANGQVIRDCFAQLERLQRERGTPCHLFVQCRKRHGDWPFAIDSRKWCED